MSAACYREPTNGVHFVRNTHRIECADPDCRGCRPCAEPRHCTARRNCTWHVAEGELTCGRCLASARRDLKWIGDLAPLTLIEAQSAGVNSEAANLAGPAADPEASMWRRLASVHRLSDLLDEGDDLHPYTVLGTWDMMLREDYDNPSDTPVTIANAAAYLDRMLHRIAHDPGQDFPLFTRELRKCRQHLEVVLHNDDRPVRGAPCTICVGIQQQTRDKLAAAGTPESEWPTLKAPRLVRHYSHWCDEEDCERLHTDTDSDDTWVCPRNRDHAWSQHDYERWVEERRTA